MQSIIFLSQSILVSFFVFLFEQVPLNMSGRFWRGAALLARYVLPEKARYVRENIKLTLGGERHLTDREVEELVRKTFLHAGNMAAEAIYISRLTSDFTRHVSLEGEHHLQEALSQGRGVVIATGHFGNWELFAFSLHCLGYKVNSIYKKLKNPYVDRFLYRRRKAFSHGLIEMKEWKKHCSKALERNECVGIVSDQDARHHGIFIDFLGKKASTYVGPALFATRFRAPLVVGFFRRISLGHYALEFEPVETRDPDTREYYDIPTITQAWVSKLETAIRACPEQYFWFHRRWKTQPSEQDADTDDAE